MPSGLVGRARETGALADLLAAALAGEARLVLCGGEPGVGRTRLATEVAARAAAAGVPVAWGAAPEPGAGAPFGPWRQVLRELLPDVDGPLDVAADLVPLGSGAPEVSRAGDDRFRLFDAVVHVLHAAARRAGLLVVLDDVDRADPDSLLLLRHVAGHLRGARALMLATHEDTAAADGLPSGPVVERMTLCRLPPEAVAAQLGVLGAPDTQARRVYELSGGNPLLVAELARELAAGRPIGVPSGVREAVTRRLGRLSPRCRHVLRAAAVLGGRVDLPVLAAVVGRPLMECLDPLDEATTACLLEPADAPG
ncbi:MAG TPA: AAA family ATPase, partial [Actinomycetospora sp.]|nr:AAA family ATPase [Actinomycetospora sp.]